MKTKRSIINVSWQANRYITSREMIRQVIDRDCGYSCVKRSKLGFYTIIHFTEIIGS